jgi:hypothetical protein
MGNRQPQPRFRLPILGATATGPLQPVHIGSVAVPQLVLTGLKINRLRPVSTGLNRFFCILIYLDHTCTMYLLNIYLKGPAPLLLLFVGLCWSSMACIGHRWSLLACVGLRGPALVFMGLRGPGLAVVGLRGLRVSSLAFVGLCWHTCR